MERRFRDKKPKEFDQALVDVARVTRVMAGGKRMRFRACVVIGNRKGQVGYAVAKGADVAIAVDKAVRKAEKHLMEVPIVNDTIPHEVRLKHRASRIILKPAPEGTGVISGGAVRSVLELAGVKNVVSKILGTNNKVSNVHAVFVALKKLRSVEHKVSAPGKDSKKSDSAEVAKEKNQVGPKVSIEESEKKKSAQAQVEKKK